MVKQKNFQMLRLLHLLWPKFNLNGIKNYPMCFFTFPSGFVSTLRGFKDLFVSLIVYTKEC